MRGSKVQQEITPITPEEWEAEGRRRFGPDTKRWRFVCPCCGHVASTQDWIDAGAPQGAIAFSCVGRWMESARDAFKPGDGPCNYAGGGLFRVAPMAVREGESVGYYFAFADV